MPAWFVMSIRFRAFERSQACKRNGPQRWLGERHGPVEGYQFNEENSCCLHSDRFSITYRVGSGAPVRRCKKIVAVWHHCNMDSSRSRKLRSISLACLCGCRGGAMRFILPAIVALSLGGCLTDSSEVSEADASLNRYQSYTCQKLRTESYAVSAKASKLTGVQDEKRSVVGGDEVTAQLSKLKGQMTHHR